jgi:hypothetical protein
MRTAKLHVHRNLHKQTWSLSLRGKVLSSKPEQRLVGVVFKVRPGGHKRAVREGVKNVHAFAVGNRPIRHYTVDDTVVDVTYNPWLADFFYDKVSGQQVIGAVAVHFTKEGSVLAYEPFFGKKKLHGVGKKHII